MKLPKKEWYTYVLKSHKDGKWYTGSTGNIGRRLKEHGDGKVRATKGRAPLLVKYYEVCFNEEDSRVREKYLKSGMGKRYLKNRLKNFLNEMDESR